MKNSVSAKNLHLSRPCITEKYSIQTTCNHRTIAIFSLPAAFYLHPNVKFFSYLMSQKISSYQTTATKLGEIPPIDFFFDTCVNLIAFFGFLIYIRFHLLSGSFVV